MSKAKVKVSVYRLDGAQLVDQHTTSAAGPAPSAWQVGDRVLVEGEAGAWDVGAVAILEGGELPPHLAGATVLYAIAQGPRLRVVLEGAILGRAPIVAPLVQGPGPVWPARSRLEEQEGQT